MFGGGATFQEIDNLTLVGVRNSTEIIFDGNIYLNITESLFDGMVIWNQDSCELVAVTLTNFANISGHIGCNNVGFSKVEFSGSVNFKESKNLSMDRVSGSMTNRFTNNVHVEVTNCIFDGIST